MAWDVRSDAADVLRQEFSQPGCLSGKLLTDYGPARRAANVPRSPQPIPHPSVDWLTSVGVGAGVAL